MNNMLKLKKKQIAFWELPQPLRNNILYFAGFSALCIVVTAIITPNIGMHFLGLSIFVLVSLLSYTFYYYYSFTRGNFNIVEGNCYDIYLVGWRKQYREYLIKSSDGRTYCFHIYNAKKSYIRVGDTVQVYVDKNAGFYTSDSVIHITQFYSAVKIKKNKK